MKSNLVKTFLVLNFLLIIAVMVFSMFFFFRDRELIKAQTLVNLEGIEATAKSLQWGGLVDWESDADRKQAAFDITLPLTMDEVTDFEARLTSLEEFAAFRLEQLETEYNTLQDTIAELRQTEDTLNIRTQELADARRKITDLNGNLAQLRQDLSEANTTISGLEREKSTLERQVKDLEMEIAGKDTEIQSLSDKLALHQKEVETVSKLLEACRGGPNTGDPREGEKPGMAAQILAIDPDWNFVVINRGEVDVLPMFSEAFVHRGEEYIGKVRVTQVERTVAIAEVLPETFVEGVQLEVGDNIFFLN